MAKRFQFRLDQVLSLRKQVEEVRVRELAQAKGRLLQIEESLKEHSREEGDFLKMFGEFEKNTEFNTDQVMAYCEYKEWLLRKEKEYRKREQEWIKEVERRRLEAVKASRARRLLENLKEKQKRTHAQEVLGEEQRFLDEISSVAFVRRERAQKVMNTNLVENLRR
jgi:flagellar protein FliJ